jgi:HSP20 family protein
MALKSLIPVGTERSATRSASNPFFALQHEIDRLFEGLARNFAGFPSGDVMPSMDLSETDKEIEITAELPGLEERTFSTTWRTMF